jgi:hypothetical protein
MIRRTSNAQLAVCIHAPALDPAPAEESASVSVTYVDGDDLSWGTRGLGSGFQENETAHFKMMRSYTITCDSVSVSLCTSFSMPVSLGMRLFFIPLSLLIQHLPHHPHLPCFSPFRARLALFAELQLITSRAIQSRSTYLLFVRFCNLIFFLY